MAVGRETVAGEVDVVADALRAVAVVAHAVETAGRVATQARGVDGSSDVAGTSQGGFDGWRHLVEGRKSRKSKALAEACCPPRLQKRY